MIISSYAANQPLFLGGGIYKWARYGSVSKVLLMPQAQYSKFCDHSRCAVVNNSGVPTPVLVPLIDRGFKRLDEVFINNPTHSISKVEKTLRGAYSKPKEPKILESLLGILWRAKDYPLGLLNLEVTLMLFKELLPDVEIEVVSRNVDCTPSRWVAGWGVAINCNQYVGGLGSLIGYINLDDFIELGITHNHQEYNMPAYFVNSKVEQRDSSISILDPLFRLGIEETRMLLQNSMVISDME